LRLLTSLRILLNARRATVVISNETNRSPLGLVLTAAGLWLLRRPILVLTEFLPGRRGPVTTWLYRTFLPRGCVAVQVMTAGEAEAYAAAYGFRPDQLDLIPFYSYDDRVQSPEQPSPGGYLISTGQNSCDWETLVAASGEFKLPLKVVCRAVDRPRLAGVGPGTTVLNDIPRDAHDELLAGASALLLVLQDRPVSMGHVRLMSAVTRGVPVIASRVRGLEGYEHLTCALVPPNDPDALVRAVREFTDNPSSLRERAAQVRDAARAYPYSAYVDRLRSMMERAAAGRVT
jgi:glycosyltransferase involved in cell wall biosynthesis